MREKLERGEAFWAKHVSDFNESGLSKAEYCRRHELKASTFHDWEKRLKNSVGLGAQFVELGSTESELKLEVNGVTVLVPSGFSAAQLRRVVEVLQC